MRKIDKNIAEEIVHYIIEIANDRFNLEYDDILKEEDLGLQEILFGLKHLNEDLLYHKDESKKVIALTELSKKNAEDLAFSEATRSKQLQDQNKELEKLSYILSHQLKTPLRGIHTLSEFIEDDLNENNLEQVKENLNTLKGRVEKMNELLSGIQEYTRIGIIQTSPKNQIDLNILLPKIIQKLTHNQQIKHKFTIVPNLPSLYCSEELITVLFFQLIKNSLNHNDKEVAEIGINFSLDHEIIQFIISDNGKGIEPSYREKIYNLFQSIQNNETKENLGIGLAVVKRIMKMLEGNIDFHSKQGDGTTFILQFPNQILDTSLDE
jgi:light-regulated signal transduction histidine kinase (bacteriophytochrome)